MSPSRLWLVAGLCALFSFGVPFTIISALSSPEPEIRIVRTGQHLSALIVDGDARLLVVQAHERGQARSLPGQVARPWEADYRTIIAPVRDDAAIGLLEVMRHPAVNHVVIAGLPGSDPVWSAVEREAGLQNINVTFVGTASVLNTNRLTIEVVPAHGNTPAHLRVVRGATIIVLLMEPGASPAPAHVTIGETTIPGPDAGLLVTQAAGVSTSPENTVLVRSNEVVRIILEPERIRFDGGRYYPADSPAN